MTNSGKPRTIAVTFLYGGEPETRCGPPAILAQWLTHRFPEVVAELEPDASLEDVIEHVQQRLQAYEIELLEED